MEPVHLHLLRIHHIVLLRGHTSGMKTCGVEKLKGLGLCGAACSCRWQRREGGATLATATSISSWSSSPFTETTSTTTPTSTARAATPSWCHYQYASPEVSQTLNNLVRMGASTYSPKPSTNLLSRVKTDSALACNAGYQSPGLPVNFDHASMHANCIGHMARIGSSYAKHWLAHWLFGDQIEAQGTKIMTGLAIRSNHFSDTDRRGACGVPRACTRAGPRWPVR